MISLEARRRLLALARRALGARVRHLPEPALESIPDLDLAAGAFVSIHRAGELRGCLGRVECDWPLPQVVRHLATVVADSDPRFDPVTVMELDEVEIEISVLTPGRQVHAVEDIEVGRHGLIVEKGSRRGLLLPQVAIEHGWDRAAFVQNACLKAGLPADAWSKGALLFVFEAEVFAEG